ncbi:MAG TPA: MATE family efflux transporter [Steroidobacteraceae bacterium]|nr:MATE family efflux transporter [Steroidobacteraceae bacterium]
MKPNATALTEGPIATTLYRFALPILLGNVLQSLNGSVNSVWVGKFLGPAALTATSNANTVLFLLLGGAFGVAMAATILVAQYAGARRLEDARRVVGASAAFFGAVSLVLALAGTVAADPLLEWMRTPADAVPLARAYLRLIFAALPFLYLYTYVMAVLRGAGDSRTPFRFLVLSVGLDIALNPLFIFGLGPLPALGIAGSALATLIANAVSLAALVAYLYRTGNPLCLRGAELRYLRFDGAIIATLLRKGLPMGLQMVLLSANAVVMISLVNRFGSATTAAYGATWQLWNYVQMPAFAIGAAVSSMAAQNVGAGHWERVARTARTGVAFSCVATGAAVLLLLLVDALALRLFLSDQATIEIARHINRVVSPSWVLFGISMVLFGVVRSTGAVLPPLVVLFIALWCVRIPFAHLMLPSRGADAIWWSFPLAAVVSSTLAFAYYRFGGWRRARMAPAGAATPTPVAVEEA